MFKTYTTEELIEVLKQHPGKHVLIEDTDVCLVAHHKINVVEVNHVDLGPALSLVALAPTNPAEANFQYWNGA